MDATLEKQCSLMEAADEPKQGQKTMEYIYIYREDGKTEKWLKLWKQMTIAILPSIVAAMMQNKARYHFAICDQAHAKHDQVGASFEFSSALITRQRTRRSRPRQIQLRRRSGPVDRLSRKKVEFVAGIHFKISL